MNPTVAEVQELRRQVESLRERLARERGGYAEAKRIAEVQSSEELDKQIAFFEKKIADIGIEYLDLITAFEEKHRDKLDKS